MSEIYQTITLEAYSIAEPDSVYRLSALVETDGSFTYPSLAKESIVHKDKDFGFEDIADNHDFIRKELYDLVSGKEVDIYVKEEMSTIPLEDYLVIKKLLDRGIELKMI